MYIGSSVNMQTRVREHVRLLNLTQHSNQHLQAAWDKYGAGAFTFDVLEAVLDKHLLYAIEQKWLDQHRTYLAQNGYNKAKDTTAPQRGLKRSAETCAKIGVTKRGNKYRLGAIVPQEMRDRIAAKLRGSKASDETRAKLSAVRKGVPHSPEWAAKIGAAHRGKVIPQEMRDRISATLRKRYAKPELPKVAKKIGRPVGIPMSEEAKERLRMANKGKTLSAEHRAKIGAAHRARTAAKFTSVYTGELPCT